MRRRSTSSPNAPTARGASRIESQMSRPRRPRVRTLNAPSIMNSPWARLMTRIMPKMTASPREITTSVAMLPRTAIETTASWSKGRSAHGGGELRVLAGVADQVALALRIGADGVVGLHDVEAVVGVADAHVHVVDHVV